MRRYLTGMENKRDEDSFFIYQSLPKGTRLVKKKGSGRLSHLGYSLWVTRKGEEDRFISQKDKEWTWRVVRAKSYKDAKKKFLNKEGKKVW